MARMRTLQDEIQGMRPPKAEKPGWRLPEIKLPVLRRTQEAQEYDGARVVRLGRDTYLAMVSKNTVWTLERARFEVRWTGRRIRQKARYLIGYVHNVLSVVFLEFVETAGMALEEGLRLWLDTLVRQTTPEYAYAVLQLVEDNVRRSRGQGRGRVVSGSPSA